MSKHIEKYNLFWWYALSMFTRILLIYLPIILMLTLINNQESDLLIRIIFQAVKIPFGLALSFNYFVKPDNENPYVPSKNFAKDQHLTNSMYYAVTTALYLIFLFDEIQNWILGEQSFTMPWFLHFLGILFGLLFIRNVIRNRRQAYSSNAQKDDYDSVILMGKALKKFKKHLTKNEIEEIEELLLIETETNIYTVNYLGRLLFYSLVVALILGIVQELIGRGYLGLAR